MCGVVVTAAYMGSQGFGAVTKGTCLAHEQEVSPHALAAGAIALFGEALPRCFILQPFLGLWKLDFFKKLEQWN